eukprot:jgi/Tetstr1/432753/TSEL_022119.t1
MSRGSDHRGFERQAACPADRGGLHCLTAGGRILGERVDRLLPSEEMDPGVWRSWASLLSACLLSKVGIILRCRVALLPFYHKERWHLGAIGKDG